TPFELRSDEEAEDSTESGSNVDNDTPEVTIDFDRIESRIVAVPVPDGRYVRMAAGPEGTAFMLEASEGGEGATAWKFSLDSRERQEFATGVRTLVVSADGSRALLRVGDAWRVVDTARPPDGSSGRLTMNLQARVDPRAERRQIFEESWRYQRDFLYDPNTHGADWDAVFARYEPLVDHVRHRDDLNNILDQVNGELSVGHSFVRGGDMPETEDPRSAGLGADLVPDFGR